MSAENRPELKVKKKRVESIDAFRGFTIFAMIFVIQVAGYHNLPLTFPHFNSAPVSTFKHAAEDGDAEEWEQWEENHPEIDYRKALITGKKNNRIYDVLVRGESEGEKQKFTEIQVTHAKPLKPGDEVIAIFRESEEEPEFRGIGNGCTFTDLVAPFFVFIVGLCIPLSRRRRGAEWWRHVGVRTIALIIAGVIYISLILKFSWWWGILQAIGVAYFVGAALMLLPYWWRWIAVAVIAAFHGFMSWHVPWWLELGDPAKGFWTIANPGGDMLKPLIVHCTPWASISYGMITVVGTLLGESIASREKKKIITRSLAIGIALSIIGYLLHIYQAPMNKDYVSPSYAVFTSGIGALSFLIFYLIIDHAGYKRWSWPFRVYGANALLAYFMQPVVRIFVVALGFYMFFRGLSGWYGMYAGFLWTMLLWCIVLWCNRKNIYWKL